MFEYIVNRNYFEFLYIIGRGGFGKVWKVKLKKTNEYFALKEMFKVKVIDRRSEFSIMSERNLLSKLKHPFIVNMHFAFQDFSKLYLVMDLLSGGDLRYHIAKRKTFSEQETKFFISNLVLALEYIHSQKIIHRDIKPENLVLDSKGYVRLTDFGVAKINERDNSSETSGTPGYMAPEVILIQNHSYAADFFALGVIGFEFMMGFRPYLGRSRKEIKDLIISKQAKIKKEDLPNGWGMVAADFINGLLQRKPSKRLGYQNISELKEHPWMKDIDWELLNKKELEAPFIPYSKKENFDKEYCEGEEKIGEETLERYDEYVQSEFFEGLFPNYTYVDMGEIINYQKTYNNTNENKNSYNLYTKTNYNFNNIDNNFKETYSNKENKNNLLVKSKHNNKIISKLTNFKVLKNPSNDKKSDNINNKYKKIVINDEDLTEIDDNKDTSNKKIKVLSEKESQNNILIKRESSFDTKNEKHKFNNINIKSDKNSTNIKSKEKKIKRGKGMINISTIQKFLLKNHNNNKINFNLTKNLFLYKSNSVKMMKNNQKDMMYYNNLINKKKEESNTTNSSKNKNMADAKDMNKNKKIENVIVQHYLDNKHINKNGLNILLNNKQNNNYPNKRHRNKSQGEGDEFKNKIMSWLNNKETTKENIKKGKLKKSKNNFLNSNNYLYLNNNKIYNINTLNKNNNFIINKQNNINTNNKAINKLNNNEDKNIHVNSNSKNININLNKKDNKENETIINHYHHPKFNNIDIKKNKLFNYLSNPNIHKKNIIQNNKFPFIYNINTFSNFPKNLLTININDSYSKDLMSSKAINIHNNNFLTSNNMRQSYKNIRNIIVNNISPTVNVLIHSEEKNIPKKHKLSNEKRVNTINNKNNYNTITNNNYNEIKNKSKKSKKIFNGVNQNYLALKKK